MVLHPQMGMWVVVEQKNILPLITRENRSFAQPRDRKSGNWVLRLWKSWTKNLRDQSSTLGNEDQQGKRKTSSELF